MCVCVCVCACLAMYATHFIYGFYIALDIWVMTNQIIRGKLLLPLLGLLFLIRGARCSSRVRAFDHGVRGCWIDPSWWTHSFISRSSKCSMTSVTKAVVCVILSVG